MSEDVEEEDAWIASLDKKQSGVSLLKPCVVKFSVVQGADSAFSKAILPDEEGEQEEDDEECPYEFQEKFAKFSMKNDARAGMTYDDLLYHPAEDEMNQNWA